MPPQPSEYFLAAIIRGYRDEQGYPVTCSDIWSQICMRAILIPGEFDRLFEWDTRKAKQNRIRTIRTLIVRGQVPGLRLKEDASGREYVQETP